ncbi:MAG TPA: DUF2238 domain-containing protein [Acidiferrobacterales bacterium]|jgi:putative membrane protein
MPRPPAHATPGAGFRRNRPLKAMLAWLALVWGWAAWAPVDRFDWLLENLLVLIYGAILIATYRRFPFSNLSYLLFTVFLTLHLVGSHYTYSQTPVGFWLRDSFDLARNHYDRIVHFSYGLLIAYPFREILLRAAGVARAWVTPLAVVTVLAFSAAFELIEAGIAVLVSPELGDAYLGTQGDIWDAQWDMGLATFGAVLAMALRAVTSSARP